MTEQVFYLSTAEDERNYFSGHIQPEAPMPAGSLMPSGTYRVVDGRLYQIMRNEWLDADTGEA